MMQWQRSRRSWILRRHRRQSRQYRGYDLLDGLDGGSDDEGEDIDPLEDVIFGGEDGQP